MTSPLSSVSSSSDVPLTREEIEYKRFRDFYNRHCETEGAVGFERALVLAEEGLGYFRDGLPAVLPTTQEEAQHRLSCLAWAIKYHAAAKGKPYTNGMAVLRPEVVRSLLRNTSRVNLTDYFGSHPYLRPSSHYKGRVEVQYGLDIARGTNDSLPADKATVLMGELEEGACFLKFETHSCHISMSWESLRLLPQTIMHGLNWIAKALFPSYFHSSNGLVSRKEKTIPKEHKRTFEQLLKAMHGRWSPEYRKEVEKVNKYGLSYINSYMNELRRSLGSGKGLTKEQAARVRPFLNSNRERVVDLNKYLRDLDNMDIRKGEEFIVDGSIAMH